MAELHKHQIIEEGTYDWYSRRFATPTGWIYYVRPETGSKVVQASVVEDPEADHVLKLKAERASKRNLTDLARVLAAVPIKGNWVWANDVPGCIGLWGDSYYGFASEKGWEVDETGDATQSRTIEEAARQLAEHAGALR